MAWGVMHSTKAILRFGGRGSHLRMPSTALAFHARPRRTEEDEHYYNIINIPDGCGVLILLKNLQV